MWCNLLSTKDKVTFNKKIKDYDIKFSLKTGFRKILHFPPYNISPFFFKIKEKYVSTKETLHRKMRAAGMQFLQKLPCMCYLTWLDTGFHTSFISNLSISRNKLSTGFNFQQPSIFYRLRCSPGFDYPL